MGVSVSGNAILRKPSLTRTSGRRGRNSPRGHPVPSYGVQRLKLTISFAADRILRASHLENSLRVITETFTNDCEYTNKGQVSRNDGVMVYAVVIPLPLMQNEPPPQHAYRPMSLSPLTNTPQAPPAASPRGEPNIRRQRCVYTPTTRPRRPPTTITLGTHTRRTPHILRSAHPMVRAAARRALDPRLPVRRVGLRDADADAAIVAPIPWVKSGHRQVACQPRRGALEAILRRCRRRRRREGCQR